MLNQSCQVTTGSPTDDSESAVLSQVAKLQEANHRFEQDLSRQKEIEKQLTQSVRELEIRTAEILADRDQLLKELHEREQKELVLRQKAEEWARSNRDLEQFASLAAHDLQEPLHSIQVFLDLLQVKHGSSLNEQGQGYVDRVTKAASRMQQLIEGMLLYSRVRASDQNAGLLSLKNIVEDILSDFNAQIDELEAEVYVGDLPMVQGDAVMIRQLFQNLLSNALKFHKSGVAPVIHISGMKIQDRRHSGPKTPEWLCQIKIQDEGVGIPAEYLDKIFGMFKRVHQFEEYGGSGIGLAVCQRIVDQCRGAISVCSSVGEGSTFTVTLPASQE